MLTQQSTGLRMYQLLLDAMVGGSSSALRTLQ
jgi:hypothetical protein